MTEADINSTLFDEVSELRDHIAALEARNARLEEQVREAYERAAQVAENTYRDHPTVSARAVNYRHAARRIADAIRLIAEKK